MGESALRDECLGAQPHEQLVVREAGRCLVKKRPSLAVVVPGLLEGLPNVAKLVAPWLKVAEEESSQVVARIG